jgi:hypothetical protein
LDLIRFAELVFSAAIFQLLRRKADAAFAVSSGNLEKTQLILLILSGKK